MQPGLWTRRGLFLILALTLGLLRGGGDGRRVAAQNGVAPEPVGATPGLSGWFSLLWACPAPGAPAVAGPVPLLTDDEGREHRLVFPAGYAEKLGGLLSLDQRRLAVQGEWIDRPREAIAVHSLQLAPSPQREASVGSAALAKPVAKPFAVLLCRFSDNTEVTPHPKNWYDGLLGNVYPGVSHFWQEASFNSFNFAGSAVYGWYNLPRPQSYYRVVAGGNLDTNKLFVDATAAADAEVNFSQFAGICIFVNDGVGSVALGTAGRTATMDGVTRPWSVSWLPVWAHNPGTVAHELGHTVGLGHTSGPYGKTYDSRWDVMSGGSYGDPKTADPTYGVTPTHTVSWYKDKLGCIPAKRKFIPQPGTRTTITLTRLALPLSADDYLMAQVFYGGWGTRFYTVELRQFAGYDAVGGLPGEAVVLHQVDTLESTGLVVDPDGNGNCNDEGAMWRPGETFTDTANGVSIAVESATATGVRVTITASPDIPLPEIASNSGDEGPGSLRNALFYANQFPGTAIRFNFAPNDTAFRNGVFTLQPTAPLPWIEGTDIVLDGSTQASRTGDTNGGRPVIVLDGSKAGAAAIGLQITGAGCQVRRLVIGGFSSHGVNVVADNYGERLLNEGATGNVVEGCFIGVNANGTAAFANGGSGIVVSAGAAGNRIGGLAPGAGNVIAGNRNNGLLLGGSGADRNLVQGNLVGTDASGLRALPNGGVGIMVYGGAQDNTLGGAVAGAGNVVAGNGRTGILIQGPVTAGTLVQGNLIGTDSAGTAALPNAASGVDISAAAQANTVGGLTAAARNVIAGNGLYGLSISGAGTDRNVVQGNTIGVDGAGRRALPNAREGVIVFTGAKGNTIGGTAAGAGNLVSGNLFSGVRIDGVGTDGNLVQGNWVGTDATGLAALPNASVGILVLSGAKGTVIGGTSARAGNLVAGNTSHGVAIQGAGTTGTVLQGNVIGLDVGGATPLANGGNGVDLANGAQNNTVGGSSPGAGNRIGGNRVYGISVSGATTLGNTLRGNLLLRHAALGINLVGGTQNNAQVTANDALDADTGPNNLQNYPVISGATISGGETILTGTLNSTPGATFAIDLFAGAEAHTSGYGEGAVYLGSATVTTDAGGNASFEFRAAGSLVNQFITATATNTATGDTSEFSLARKAS